MPLRVASMKPNPPSAGEPSSPTGAQSVFTGHLLIDWSVSTTLMATGNAQAEFFQPGSGSLESRCRETLLFSLVHSFYCPTPVIPLRVNVPVSPLRSELVAAATRLLTLALPPLLPPPLKSLSHLCFPDSIAAAAARFQMCLSSEPKELLLILLSRWRGRLEMHGFVSQCAKAPSRRRTSHATAKISCLLTLPTVNPECNG